MKIEQNLAVIKKHGQIKEDQNFKFRSFLKGKDSEKTDKIVHELYAEVVKKVDCSECANCCIELETGFEIEEIDQLTKSLKIDKNEFIKNSTIKDEDMYYLNSKPCQFLDNKICTILELRPENCNSYPYIHKDGFTSRLLGVLSNYEICPIVYNVYELLKKRFNFR